MFAIQVPGLSCVYRLAADVTVVSTGTWGPRVRLDWGKSWEPAHYCTIACDCSYLVMFCCLLGRSITSSCSTWFYCLTPSPF